MSSKSRRDFLKKAAVMAGTAGVTSVLPSSIVRAMAIDAAKGTTFYDAEHVVILMQENRSFDHIFGCMKGVRGFGNPRAKILPDGNKVWVQKNKEGNAITPFHLDIHKTRITWQGGLPHSWPDQIGARNNGKYDKWLPFKTPMTMGYFNRQDVPFYYALADAFTVCDHYFCSSLTGTTPNRLFMWTGNIRPQPDGNSLPAVHNSHAESRNNTYVDWTTFPELLEDNNISWKIYQNEVWTAGLPDELDYWLGNYGDNAIEYLKRHQVKLSAYFRKNGDKTVTPARTAAQVQAAYEQLSQRERNLIDKAFTTNIAQEDYLRLEPFTFKNEGGTAQTVDIPKEDIFYQFRKDVESGNLPTVSWLAAPQAFSDHTSTPFYGTWYVSQVLDILTQNPEIWKKTIFILNYDENDGYYDHLPPFVVPGGATGGKVSPGIDVASDYAANDHSPIGLGFRVPMIVASPWSKGGYVNSEIFDHTSTLMFLEKFLKKKAGKKIHVENISSWRRTVCGDLTSVFRPYNGETYPLPEFQKRETVIADIQKVRNKPKQEVMGFLSAEAIKKVNETLPSPFIGDIEKGTRPACALPYRLHASCRLNRVSGKLELVFKAEPFNGAKGAAFNMYTAAQFNNEPGKTWAYAVRAGDRLEDYLELLHFPDGKYHLCIDGPNGFQRQFSGNAADPDLEVTFNYPPRKLFSRKSGEVIKIILENKEDHGLTVQLKDNAYNRGDQFIELAPGKKKSITINLLASSGWYDFSVSVKGNRTYAQQYAGHLETGAPSVTDPFMGGEV